MKVKIELFGASRDFSNHNSLDLNLNNNSTIKDIRNELINYLDEKFNGNESYKHYTTSCCIYILNIVPRTTFNIE